MFRKIIFMYLCVEKQSNYVYKFAIGISANCDLMWQFIISHTHECHVSHRKCHTISSCSFLSHGPHDCIWSVRYLHEFNAAFSKNFQIDQQFVSIYSTHQINTQWMVHMHASKSISSCDFYHAFYFGWFSFKFSITAHS